MLDTTRPPSPPNLSTFSYNIRKNRKTSQEHANEDSMSGLELLAVVSCVAAVCSAYHDGAALVQQIKAKRKARKALGALQIDQDTSLQDVHTLELERSLQRGRGVVQDQYDFQFRRFGPAFEKGDRELPLPRLPYASNPKANSVAEIARDGLKDIIIYLQGQLISNLKVQWQQDTFLDVSTLQDVSDESQNQAILILMQLQQRMITAGPIENLKPPPLFSYPESSNSYTQALPVHQIINSPPASPSTSNGSPPPPPAYKTWSTLPPSPTAMKSSPVSVTPISEKEPSRFGSIFRRRSKAESVMKAPEHFVEANYLQPARLEPYAHNRATSRDFGGSQFSDTVSTVGSISTEKSSIIEPDDPQYNPWGSSPTKSLPTRVSSARSPFSQSPSTQSSLSPISMTQNPINIRRNSTSFSSQRRVPTSNLELVMSNMAINPKDLLPNEANKFAGFCKGAWRLQIGDTKKAMEERQRPGGMYSANGYWQCKKCTFQGRMVLDEKKKKGYDRRVLVFSEGIQFRWQFLFKSHIETKELSPDPSQATFGCVFCCVEGRGTPTFGGVQTFMNHLQEHRDRQPNGEVLYRMNCIVGRRAELNEDFDVNLMTRFVEDF